MHNLDITIGISAALVSGALLLSACADQEKSAQAGVEKAQQAWQAESNDLDALQRLKRYDQIIKDVTDVGRQYPATTYGKAIVAGRSINGVSLAAMRRTRDALAPRAVCYANPTVECLRAYSSHPGGVSGAAAPDDAFAEAQRLVCSKGFADADHALDSFKINKPVYSQQLVQVALAANQCHKTAQVQAAVAGYLATLPAAGDERRTQALLSIVATDDLESAWAKPVQELEAELKAPNMPKNQAAGIATVLALADAKRGDTKAALEKYHFVTDTLGYRFNPNAKQEFSRQLILHGAADQGLKYIEPGDLMHQAIALNDAAMAIGNRLKLTSPGYHAPVLTLNTLGLEQYMAPVDASERARADAQAGAVEAALDNMAARADRSVIRGYGNSSDGLDDSYGIIAMVHQKLGEPAKASAALKKGEDLRTRLLGANGHTDDYFAQFQTTLALAQGDTDAAIKYLKTLSSLTGGSGYVRLVLKAMAEKGEGAQALSLLGDPTIHNMGNRNDSCYYCSDLVADLIASSQFDAAKKVIQAIPGGANQQARYYQQIDDRMAADGDQSGAEAFAKQHGLIKSPGDRLHLLYGLMDARKIGGNRKRAEPILREMFDIAQTIDQNPSGYPGRWDQYTADRVVARAFSEGYTDLGIELYRKAAYKDQRPLFAAFTDNMKPQDMTPVLMLAQDNLDPRKQQIVIDAAIRHLQKTI